MKKVKTLSRFLWFRWKNLLYFKNIYANDYNVFTGPDILLSIIYGTLFTKKHDFSIKKKIIGGDIRNVDLIAVANAEIAIKILLFL